MTKPKKPAPIPVGGLTLNPIATRKDGAWKWRAFWYENNETRSRVLGWFIDPDDAERAGAKLLSDGLPEKKAKEVEPELRFDDLRDLLQSWVDGLDKRVGDGPGQLAKATRDQYDNRVGHLIGKVGIGHVALGRITGGTLGEYRDRRLDQGGAPSTVFAELIALRIAWTWGRQRGVCPNFDLPGCDVQIEGVRNDYTPSRDEVAAVLATLNGWPLVAVLGLATTGARISEMGNMLEADLVIESRPREDGQPIYSGWWNLRGRVERRGKRVGKTGARAVPLKPEFITAVLALRGLKAGRRMAAPGWPSRPEHVLGVAPKTCKTSIEDVFLPRACAAAGVTPFTPHGLRRYFEDELAEAGVDIAEYAAILGHSEATALKHYRRVRAVNLARAAAKVPAVSVPALTQGAAERVRKQAEVVELVTARERRK